MIKEGVNRDKMSKKQREEGYKIIELDYEKTIKRSNNQIKVKNNCKQKRMVEKHITRQR